MLSSNPTHHEQVAHALLKAGADFEKPNNNGWTPLMKACSNGHQQCAHALLMANADPNKANAKGWVALMYACHNGHLEVTCPA